MLLKSLTVVKWTPLALFSKAHTSQCEEAQPESNRKPVQTVLNSLTAVGLSHANKMNPQT